MAEVAGGPSVVQGYALYRREYEEAKRKADRAQARMYQYEGAAKQYIKEHGSVVCDFNNTDEKMTIYLDADGFLRHVNVYPLFDHDS